MDSGDRAMQGWDALVAHLEAVYPGVEPRHWGTVRRYAEGGPDPLDGISAYPVPDPCHWHWISFGMSELGPKQSVDPDISGWGFEFSFRLSRPASLTTPPEWPVVFLQTLARYVYNTGNPFAHADYIGMGGPLSRDEATHLSALVFITDPILQQVQTPNGRVTFVTPIGISEHECRHAETAGADALLQRLLTANPLGLTDLLRKAEFAG